MVIERTRKRTKVETHNGVGITTFVADFWWEKDCRMDAPSVRSYVDFGRTGRPSREDFDFRFESGNGNRIGAQ
jgi:hypothetical protein